MASSSTKSMFWYDCGNNNVGEKQREFLESLEIVAKHLKNNGITFFLACGTALGCVRSGTFIEHDKDIDIGIFSETLRKPKWRQFVRELLSDRRISLHKQRGFTEIGYELSVNVAETGVKVDMMGFYPSNKAKWGRWWASYKFWLTPEELIQYHVDPFLLETRTFYGKSYLVPTSEFFHQHYGADWRVPKEFTYTQGVNGEYKSMVKTSEIDVGLPEFSKIGKIQRNAWTFRECVPQSIQVALQKASQSPRDVSLSAAHAIEAAKNPSDRIVYTKLLEKCRATIEQATVSSPRRKVGKWTDNCCFSIKTFMRVECVTVLIESIFKCVENAFVIVLDDSPEPENLFSATWRNDSILWIRTETDIGTAEGRNRLCNAALTEGFKYFINLDADFVIDRSIAEKFPQMHLFMQFHPQYCLIGGNLGNRITLMPYTAKFSTENNELVIRDAKLTDKCNPVPGVLCDVYKTDRTHKFFMGRTESLLASWDPFAMVLDHTDMFVHLKVAAKPVACMPSALVQHHRLKTRSPLYETYRARFSTCLKSLQQYTMAKYSQRLKIPFNGNEKTVITFGTFDLLHIGHIRILRRAKKMGTRLVVGISSDALSLQKKNRKPVYSEQERLEIVSSLKFVDEVFLEESLELKPDYIKKYHADLFTIGDDWRAKFDDMLGELCEIVYLPRTETVSTTETIERIKT